MYCIQLNIDISNMKCLESLVLAFIFATKCMAQLPRIQADPENHWFLDSGGRVRLFHGVNCVQKGFPWYKDEYMLNDTRLDHLQEWGMNIVRLGSMWSGVEPEEGVYNATYLDILQTIVDKLADRGMYTILDMHQDVMSSKFKGYDGVPLWLVDKYPPPQNPYPWPLDDIVNWEDGYFTQAASEGFQYFYENANNSISHWAQFWGKLASTFAGNTNVFGYNLMNEPWIGDYISNFNRTYPGYSGAENLMPNYDIVNEEIRKYDVDSMILYEPVIYGQLNQDPIRGSGFSEVPGGDEYQSVSAFSFHTYCWPLEFADSNATDEELLDLADYCAKEFLPQKFESALANINRTGGGVILTEFGVCKTYEDGINIECSEFMRIADDFLMSWTEWDYSDLKFYDNEGNVVEEKVFFYARPYARAITGVPTYMNFNFTTFDFHFEFALNTDIDISLPTEVFVPMMHYACGFDVVTSGNLAVDQVEQDVLHFFYNPDSVQGERATITITKGLGCM